MTRNGEAAVGDRREIAEVLAPEPIASSRPDLGTGGALVLAAGAVAGSAVARPLPVVLAVALATVGWVAGRRLVLVVGVVLLASGLGARAVDGLAPVARAPFAGEVELVTDPRPVGTVGWRAEVRLPSGQRVRASAHGAAGRALSAATAGRRVVVEGRLAPLAQPDGWTRSRHLVGTLAVEEVGRSRPGSALARAADAVRRLVAAGADRLPPRHRALYLGLVVGDDRFQAPSQQAAFRVAGLSHLLAVSGQNVAFVLVVAGPALRRLSTWPRFAAMVAVLVLFAAVTRFEPSVLRATTTAGIVAWSVALGRPARGLRVLALAVTGLVLVDPLLVHSVGFQLSVAASAGILALGPHLERALRGPAWLRRPLAVTASAQVAVLPLLTAVFGPVSLVSIPANLAVSAAAGLVMTWGLTVGVVAGAVGPTLGGWLQAPAVAALWWIDEVAAAAAVAPAPRIASWAVAPLVAAALVGWWWRGVRPVMVVVAAVVVLAPVVPGTSSASGGLPGARWCPPRSGAVSVLVVDDASHPAALVEGLLDRGVRSVDVVVLARGSRPFGSAVRELDAVLGVGLVLAPAQHEVRGARAVREALAIATGAGTVGVSPAGPGALTVAGCRPAR